MNPIAAISIPTPNWREALEWYAKAFPKTKRITIPEQNFECLELQGIRIECVQADEKVPSAAAGTMIDWNTENFDESLEHFKKLGATLYRGPMQIEDGKRMCKLKDPYGNIIGLRG